jgi:hypothetical protein
VSIFVEKSLFELIIVQIRSKLLDFGQRMEQIFLISIYIGVLALALQNSTLGLGHALGLPFGEALYPVVLVYCVGHQIAVTWSTL